jgi:hypothetical protein
MALSDPIIRRKCHESVMSIVMGSGTWLDKLHKTYIYCDAIWYPSLMADFFAIIRHGNREKR